MRLLIEYYDKGSTVYEEERKVKNVIVFIKDKAVKQINSDGVVTKPKKERLK